ncbi:hypothetical protein FisN_9Lh181 [Fistulifera solaris]|uniref:Uncharacterized protein n=1 Tax=Fistulifera solaris TaxID=1519565 RepID=A0A1Z5KL20_FISSO|nr:hypothetical protein FisN_9Lh181 [Fistulifera solaris]|eukprot:GAX26887.1 hypothetical protein FisN_9Lh181 [Fistulifera solaris]
MTDVTSQVLQSSHNPQKKAKCHRRRYAPVGPAGVLFQAQREQLNAKNGSILSISMNEESHEEERGIEFTQGIAENTKAPTSGVVFYSRAWVDMLCHLQIVTPMLRSYLSEQQRYTTIRRFMPPKFVMILEILRGQVDWKLPPNKSLLVLVHTIDARSDTLWVVELLDETGANINAWIKPRFVEQEQKLPKYVRIGMVWMLKEVTILLHSSPGSDSKATSEANDYRRMLLVGEQNIECVWSPPANEEDGDTADPRFIEWIEKRNTLTSSLESVGEDCDEFDAIYEPEETTTTTTTFPTSRSERMPTPATQQQQMNSPGHLFLEREQSPMVFPTNTNSPLPPTPREPRTPIKSSTNIHSSVISNNQRQNQSGPSASSAAATSHKRKGSSTEDEQAGLWRACPGEEDLALFSSDDDDEYDSSQLDKAAKNDKANHTPTNSIPPLLSSSPKNNLNGARKPVANIFQHNDFVNLDLDCSSDEE